MTKRITRTLIVAFGLVALACGGRAEPATERDTTTAGMETPPPAVPQGQQSGQAQPQNRQATVAIPEGAEPGTLPPAQPSERSSEQPTELLVISDAEVTAFVDALVQLAMLEQQGMARVEAGESQEQVAASLQPQVDGIFQNGTLTPKRFADIASQADRDPALAQRIETQLEQRLQQESAAEPPV